MPSCPFRVFAFARKLRRDEPCSETRTGSSYANGSMALLDFCKDSVTISDNSVRMRLRRRDLWRICYVFRHGNLTLQPSRIAGDANWRECCRTRGVYFFIEEYPRIPFSSSVPREEQVAGSQWVAFFKWRFHPGFSCTFLFLVLTTHWRRRGWECLRELRELTQMPPRADVVRRRGVWGWGLPCQRETGWRDATRTRSRRRLRYGIRPRLLLQPPHERPWQRARRAKHGYVKERPRGRRSDGGSGHSRWAFSHMRRQGSRFFGALYGICE
jgi:hypothetical protein